MATTSSAKAKDRKQVICTYCGGSNEVSAKALSIFCSHCRKSLDLEDHKIASYYAVREFFTCGDVVVEKNGHVVAPIRAANVTVKGRVQGRVTAQQRVHITKTGTFKGDIEAPSIEIDLGGVLDGFVRIGAQAPT